MNSNSEEKLGPIRRYLRNQFLGHEVEDEYHSESQGQIFAVERGSILYRARISREFLDDHTPAEITNLLHQWNLARALQYAGGVMVQVTNAGIS